MPLDELGPMPEPTTEPSEPNPGGVDAITHEMEIPLVADLDPSLPPPPAAAPVPRPRPDGGD